MRSDVIWFKFLLASNIELDFLRWQDGHVAIDAVVLQGCNTCSLNRAGCFVAITMAVHATLRIQLGVVEFIFVNIVAGGAIHLC